MKNGGLVKTVNFGSPKYVGDPINAVKIFNEKEVDEITVLDIDATALGKEPDYRLIEELAAECRMPLCYGGGVNSVEQIGRLVSLGVEKVAISSAAVLQPELIADASGKVGAQSVVVVLDVRRCRGGADPYEIWTHNGTKRTRMSPITFAKEAQALGAGEVVINSIDRDGMMNGYDIELAGAVRRAISIPLTVLGGAGSLGHIRDLFAGFGIIGAAAGSLFVFKGVFRAVLISYPDRTIRDSLYPDSCDPKLNARSPQRLSQYEP